MSKHDFNLLGKAGLNLDEDEEKRELLLRKGVFPYEYCTSIEKLERAKALPPREEFFSKLINDTITEEDHQHGCKVFSKFHCKTMIDYMKLY